MTRLAWGAKVNAEFRGRVVEICQDVDIPDPSWLMACMCFETGGTFSASVRNRLSGAVGLIQFMSSTAKSLGTTAEELAKMTDVQQLDYVKKYFEPFRGRIRTISDCYMAILWPKAVGKPEDFVIFVEGTSAYAQNAGLDTDKDHAVTKAECAALIIKRLNDGLLDNNVADSEIQPAAPIEEASHQQENDMADITNTIADAAPVVGTVFGGPIGGLIGGLASALIKGFQPLAQEKIAKEVGRHTSQETATQVSNVLTTGLVDLAQQLTNKSDPVEAVVAAKADPIIMQKLETSTMAKLDELVPFLDKINSYERSSWSSEEESRLAASDRAQSDIGAKIQWREVMFTQYAVGASTILVGLLLAIQVYFDSEHKPNGELMILLTALVMGFANTFRTQNDYAFGSSRGSDAKTAGLTELAARRSRN